MDTAARLGAFLDRLWELQKAAGITDAELARRMHVDQALISRAKRPGAEPSFGMKFALGACDLFPELLFFLASDMSIITSDVRIDTSEGAA